MGDNAMFFKKNLKAVMVTRSVVFVSIGAVEQKKPTMWGTRSWMDNDVFDINLL